MKSMIKSMFTCVLGTMIGLSLFLFLGVSSLILFSHVITTQFGEGKIEKGSVLFLPLEGEVVERKGNMFMDWEEDSPFFRGPRHIGLWEVQQALKKAKEDPRIKGLYIKIGPLAAGWASLTSLVTSLADFKKSGKFVHVYGEAFDEKSYFVATIADRIHAYPEGSFEFNGIAAVPVFIKGTLDKLGIRPMIFRVGEFKSAVETFTQEKMSEPSRQQTRELIDDIWNHYISQISQLRGIPPESLNRVAAELLVTKTSEALEQHLVDDASSEEQVLDQMKTLVQSPKDKKLDLVSLMRYFKITEEPSLPQSRKKIGILFASGEIISGSSSEGYVGSEDFLASLRQIAKDKEIKALVLRVNSPGGSALAADVIWRQILELKKSKPVVASFGDVAASGGYYIAAGANHIFAYPQSVTGSIGVFGVMFNAQEFSQQKLGLSFDRVASHPHADIGSSTRKMLPIEQQKIQKEVEQTYQQFLRVVQQGRDFDSLEETDHLAQGRVWSGLRAKELGLVDEFGGLGEALAKAAELAQLGDSWDVEIFPQEKSPLQQFVQVLTEMSFLQNWLLPDLLSQEEWGILSRFQHLKKMGRLLALDPQPMQIK